MRGDVCICDVEAAEITLLKGSKLITVLPGSVQEDLPHNLPVWPPCWPISADPRTSSEQPLEGVRRLAAERATKASRQAHFITVNVKKAQTTIELRVDPMASVERTKELAGVGVWSPSGEQNHDCIFVRHDGWQLLHGKTLADYNIQDGSTLYTLPRLWMKVAPGHTAGGYQPDLSRLPDTRTFVVC